MKAKAFLYGIVIGGVAAGIGTLLAAPASGTETRRKIGKNKDIIIHQLVDLRDSLVDLKNTAVTASKEGKSALSDFASDVKLSIYEWKLKTEPNQEEIRNEISNIEKAIEKLEAAISPATPSS